MKCPKRRSMRVMATISKIKTLLLQNNRILLLCHVSPDGDCLGSLLALGRALRSFGKDVIMACEDRIPSYLEFLLEAGELYLTEDVEGSFDVAVAIDAGDAHRLGKKGLELFKSAKTTINIDHHASNPEYGHINLVDPSRAATGEIIMDLIETMGLSLEKSLSVPLYTAIFTDTGGFRYSNTTADTLKKAALLVEAGVEPSLISSEIHENKSLNYFKLLAKSFTRLTIADNVCYTWISYKEVDELGLDFGAAEELTTYTKMVGDVDVAIVFKEKEDNLIKVSLRSHGKYDVAKLAARFGGGGHKQAAGLVIEGSVNQAIEQVLKATKEVH